MTSKQRLILIMGWIAVGIPAAFGTHIRSADIRVEAVCGSQTFKITITAYVNTTSSSQFGEYDGWLYFGDGNSHDIVETAATPRPDLGVNIGVVVYTIDHTYAAPGNYQIVYREGDRNNGILNMTNSGDTDYVSYIIINTDHDFGCNHYPVLDIPPVDRACFKNTFTHAPGVTDADGDSISYEITTPLQGVSTAVAGYVDPHDPRFYTNFSAGNEMGTGPPLFYVDPESGLITWDAPGMVGEYNIAFKIVEWRYDPVTDNYVMLSTTVRDMQIIVEDCPNMRPDLTTPSNICIEAGTVLSFAVAGTDPDDDPVKIEAVSEIFDFPAGESPASYSPFPPDFIASDTVAKLYFKWSTDCMHVRQQPYQVTFKITDNPPGGVPLVTFKTWSIKVIAPAPTWKNYSLDLVNRHAKLEWDGYACANASNIQVWRRVGNYPHSGGLCETGLPRSQDYDLIGEVDAAATSFIDTRLAPGAVYCYRLVAIFRQATIASSYPSDQICLDPIDADAPVITHVTVEETDASEGTIRLRWRSPFDINASQYPAPYRYELYRAVGFAGDSSLTKAGLAMDTTFVDADINTLETPYNYRIVLYAIPDGHDEFVPVDTSAVASSEWLTAIPGLNEISLSWRDSVPWSTVVTDRPYHLVYRGSGLQSQEDMILLDSVNVATEGFNYVDQNLEADVFYFYRIKTRGTYGNPLIRLQENFSQVAAVYPVNDLRPCPPTASVVPVDCQLFASANSCDQQGFENTVFWRADRSPGCRIDIDSYNLYASTSMSGEFEIVASGIADTLFIERQLPSFAKCYRVTAVDRSGQESLMSEPVCSDNCPYFELPNVFTPNGDGCNDIFTPYHDVSTPGETRCNTVDLTRCPRFVNAVRLRVYNRWGREVYAFNSNGSSSVYINWDGRDKDRSELESGIYFYHADVSFDVLDPALQRKKYKGWVHLMR